MRGLRRIFWPMMLVGMAMIMTYIVLELVMLIVKFFVGF